MLFLNAFVINYVYLSVPCLLLILLHHLHFGSTPRLPKLGLEVGFKDSHLLKTTGLHFGKYYKPLGGVQRSVEDEVEV